MGGLWVVPNKRPREKELTLFEGHKLYGLRFGYVMVPVTQLNQELQKFYQMRLTQTWSIFDKGAPL